jgi:hypothetical protein
MSFELLERSSTALYDLPAHMPYVLLVAVSRNNEHFPRSKWDERDGCSIDESVALEITRHCNDIAVSDFSDFYAIHG